MYRDLWSQLVPFATSGKITNVAIGRTLNTVNENDRLLQEPVTWENESPARVWVCLLIACFKFLKRIPCSVSSKGKNLPESSLLVN